MRMFIMRIRGIIITELPFSFMGVLAFLFVSLLI